MLSVNELSVDLGFSVLLRALRWPEILLQMGNGEVSRDSARSRP